MPNLLFDLIKNGYQSVGGNDERVTVREKNAVAPSDARSEKVHKAAEMSVYFFCGLDVKWSIPIEIAKETLIVGTPVCDLYNQ